MKRIAEFGFLAMIAVAVACSDAVSPGDKAAQVIVSPDSAFLFAGQEQRFSATVLDARGQPLAVTGIKWTITGDYVTIDSTGLARMVSTPAAGFTPVTVTATVGKVAGAATVNPERTAAITIWPDTNVLFAADTRQLTARIEPDVKNGSSPPTIQSVTVQYWTSLDPAIATVDAAGTVTAHGVGHTTIVGYYADRVGRADISVIAAPSQPIKFTKVTSGSVLVARVGQGSAASGWSVRGCGLATTGKVWCWGAGVTTADGKFDRCDELVREGPGVYTRHRFRCSLSPVPLETNLTFKQLAANSSLACAVDMNDQVQCWGSNEVGELGIGSADTGTHGVTALASTDRFRSVHVSEIQDGGVPGAVTACAIRLDDVAVCWGSRFGASPTPIAGLRWRMMGEAGHCGLVSDSTAYCVSSSSDAPTPFAPGARWKTLISGGVHGLQTCAVSSADEFKCGDPPSVISAATPSPSQFVIRVSPPVDIVQLCVLSADGTVYCSGAAAPEYAAVKFKQFFGTCGLSTDDVAWCLMQGTLRRLPGQ